MLSLLTSYLISSKRVCIPQVGTFELRYQPASLNFADRLIYAPATQVVFMEEDEVPQEQLNFLGFELGTDLKLTEASLTHFGKRLKKGLAKNSFNWVGFGELKWENEALVFEPAHAAQLPPVAANKIIRENAHHGVLVGEKEMHSSDTSYINEQEKSHRSYAVLTGWIIALLALAFIIYWLYNANFHPFSTGLQQKALSLLFNN